MLSHVLQNTQSTVCNLKQRKARFAENKTSNMKTIVFSLFIALVSLSPLNGQAQDCNAMTRTELRAMLVELGYTVIDLEKAEGKQKYQVNMSANGLNVPVGYEISPSNNFIWLTVNLGNPPSETSTTNNTLLKQNAIIQPCFMYITEKGRLMMGLAVENRGLTNAVLKRHSDFIAKRVGETKSYWQQ